MLRGRKRAAQHASLKKWIKRVHEGPASGLRRQHKFSRCAAGWTPTAKSSGTVSKTDTTDEIDAVDGLSHDQLDELREQLSSNFAPANAQQEADDEATAWHKQWGKGLVMRPVAWPTDLGDDLPEIVYQELVDAGDTFPVETGLGWDRLHPRVIGRLPKPLVIMLISLIIQCELEGQWPEAVAVVA